MRSSSTSRPVDRANLRARVGERGHRAARAARARAGRLAPRGVERGGTAASWGWSTRSASRRGRPRPRRSLSPPPAPRCSIADCVRLPTILCVLEITRSAPATSACAGSVLVEGHVRAPGLVDDQRHAAGVGDLGQRRARRRRRRSRSARRPTRRPRRASRASALVERLRRVRQWAMPSSGSSSGATNVGRSPESTSASIVLECALRCTTTSSPWWASASPAARLPCEAPLTRNHARLRAPGLGGELLRLLERRRLEARRRCRRSARGCPAPARARRSPPAAAGSAPGPPLCPGTCSRAGSRAAYSRSASRYGACCWLAVMPLRLEARGRRHLLADRCVRR